MLITIEKITLDLNFYCSIFENSNFEGSKDEY